MRKILVTGSNKGLGLEIVRKLLKKEFTVISTGRAVTKDIEKLLKENKNRFFFEEFDWLSFCAIIQYDISPKKVKSFFSVRCSNLSIRVFTKI